MRNKKFGVLGIVLFTIGILSIFINDSIESDFLKKISEFGKFISILGGGLIGIGFFGKKKQKKNN
ncbi:hypothetical protein [uncultured Mesonia sp.]|uniref:hypothetical protein n=1 Tax=uncultured Mesonia sp. TaxID=399731 RepID=UPI00374E33CE